MTAHERANKGAPADLSIAESLEKCLWAFTSPADRTLIVTPLPAALFRRPGGTTVITADRPGKTAVTQPDARHAIESTEQFDTVLLDRCWDDDAFDAPAERSHSPQSWLGSIRSKLAADGRLLVVASRRRTAAARRALAANGLRAVGVYALVPDLAPMHHLVSIDARALRTFMLRAHGLPTGLPARLAQWPKWMAVRCGADRLTLRWFVLHARA